MEKPSFGETLKNARLTKGFSLRELARRLDISHPYLSQLENGKNDTPSILILKKLARILDVPFFYLALLSNTEIGLRPDAAEDAKETLRVYQNLLKTTAFFKKLQSFDYFKDWLTNDVFYDRGDIRWSEPHLKDTYRNFTLFKEIEEKFMSSEEVSLIDAFTKGSSPAYSTTEIKNELTGIGKTQNIPLNDFYYHIDDNATKTYKNIPLSKEDKISIKEFIENYLIRKLSAEDEVDREAIKILLDENFRFPHEKE